MGQGLYEDKPRAKFSDYEPKSDREYALEKAATELYSAISCALSTLRGMNVLDGGRIQFIEGVLKKHERYAPKAGAELDKADAILATHILKP